MLASIPPANAFKEDKNWPCVQGKMKKISAAASWPGFSIKDDDTSWQSNELVKGLAKKILPRRVELAKTEKIIKAFAENQGDNRDALLEQVYAALINETNRTRSDVIGGIGRFAKRQRDLAERIKTSRRMISDLEKKDQEGTLTKEEDKVLAKFEQQLEWDIRIHEEREQSLDHVCEVPVIISQRLYAISKQLQKYHSKIPTSEN